MSARKGKEFNFADQPPARRRLSDGASLPLRKGRDRQTACQVAASRSSSSASSSCATDLLSFHGCVFAHFRYYLYVGSTTGPRLVRDFSLFCGTFLGVFSRAATLSDCGSPTHAPGHSPRPHTLRQRYDHRRFNSLPIFGQHRRPRPRREFPGRPGCEQPIRPFNRRCWIVGKESGGPAQRSLVAARSAIKEGRRDSKTKLTPPGKSSSKIDS